MAIKSAQKQAAEKNQWVAASDNSPQVRLIAGPGTGKTRTIEKRIIHLLSNNATPQNIYVISFTRASCEDLRERVSKACSLKGCSSQGSKIHISTMHSLALSILRRANMLISYPSTPIMLDTWEQKYVYDRELSISIGCSMTRAAEIRRAHDAAWQTLNPIHIAQARITRVEATLYKSFHAARTNLYCCVLPGEIIYKCVEGLKQGAIMPHQLPRIENLIVDEFQDLNACDQEFIKILSSFKTNLFIAGDDDQSIYSFRHADPTGIVQFPVTYAGSTTHILNECFRCTPEILDSATTLISINPNRVSKSIVSLYATSSPPVQGKVMIWGFHSSIDEANAIASSCRELINQGMAGRENEILILISNRRVQLEEIKTALGNQGIPYEQPRGTSLVDEYDAIRAVYSLIRILRDLICNQEDYPAFRDLLGVLFGVGHQTVKDIADNCIKNNQNFRELFLLPSVPSWLGNREQAAVSRIMSVVGGVSNWTLQDELGVHTQDIATLLSKYIFTTGKQAPQNINLWNTLAMTLPSQMTLEELLLFLSADTDSDQEAVIEAVEERLGRMNASTSVQKKVRILTMHGAKGLSGRVVFIPTCEQGIIPNTKSLKATGLLIEQRRLLYVSITRAMACCIISHSSLHRGAPAMALAQKPAVSLSRSQFLAEMGATSVSRSSGLSAKEAKTIVTDIKSL